MQAGRLCINSCCGGIFGPEWYSVRIMETIGYQALNDDDLAVEGILDHVSSSEVYTL